MANNVATPVKTLHTEKQESVRLGFSIRTLQAWRVRGDGPPYLKIGQSVRYEPRAVDAWLDARARTNTTGLAAQARG